MAFQLKRTFELIDPSTFDSAAALRNAAVSYYIDLTFDGDDDDVEEISGSPEGRRRAIRTTILLCLSMPSRRSAIAAGISPMFSTC
jgi:hypothetical protein